MVDEELLAQIDAAFQTWAADLSPSGNAALREYQGNGYMRVNEILRDIDDGSTLGEEGLLRVDEMIEALDSAVAGGAVPVTVEVHRGVRDVTGWLPRNLSSLVGTTFTDPGFLSTSLDVDAAVNKVRLGKNPAVFILQLSPGQQAAWLRPVGKAALRDEYELLLPRNTSIRIASVSRYRGIPMIRGEVI